jgi:hypothetical protein
LNALDAKLVVVGIYSQMDAQRMSLALAGRTDVAESLDLIHRQARRRRLPPRQK